MTRTKGFTLVELLIVMPGMFIVAAFIAAFLVTLYQNTLIKNSQIELGIDAQNTLYSLRDDLFFANRFAGEIQPDTIDAHAPAGGWNAITHNALIVYEAAYDKNRQTVNRQLIFRRDSPHPCTDEHVTENQFSTNTMIYFVQDATLYKRTLIPDQSLNCLSTFRSTSCPSTSAGPTCPADIPLVRNVKSVSYTYYNRVGTEMPASSLQSASDIDKFIQVKRAVIDLTLEMQVAGEIIDSHATITIRKTE